MQRHVPLLRGAQGLQVRQAFPVFQVLRPDNSGRGHRRGKVRVVFVLALGAEHTVDPAVLMLRQPHVVYVGLLLFRVRQDHRVIPEAEALGGFVAFRHGEEALAVRAFHAHHHAVLPVQLDGAAVHRRVDTQPLHHEGIGFRVRVIHPEGRDMLPGQHRVPVADVQPVVEMLVRRVRPRQQPLVGFHQGIKTSASHFFLSLFFNKQKYMIRRGHQ